VVVLYGARRVGKTTLVQKFLESYRRAHPGSAGKILFVNGDDLIARSYLESQSIQSLKSFVGDHDLLVIDEAQYIRQVGLNLKLIVDHIPQVKVIATGSSSFDLARDIGEPLTGRKFVLTLYPLAQLELASLEEKHETKARQQSRLIYGSYPEVITLPGDRQRQEYLRELVSSYLFKDILALEGIRHSNKLIRLLQLLAFQIGKQVSMNELGMNLGMSKNTVEKYIDLLEKVFVLHHLTGFSRNLRKEIAKNHRYFFLDNGVRNAVIGNFNPLDMRDDVGQLWENYIVTERIKRQEYRREWTHFYYWRTYDKQEIDLIEERAGTLTGYEIKWQAKTVKAPPQWLAAYPGAGFEIIHQGNYLDFIC